MAEFFYFVLFAAGLLLVIKGSDWFVDSAVWGAEAFRIPPILIGATIVSICTTLPETFVSASAALKGESIMAIGNSLGSIGANTGFILSILLIATRPVIENRREFLQNSFFLAFLLIFLWAVGFLIGEISKTMGIVLIIMMLAYIVKNVFSARNLMDLDIQYDIEDEENVLKHMDLNIPLPDGIAYDEEENDFNVSFQMIIRKTVFFVLGVGFVLLGSNLLVDNGIRIAEILHVPTMVIAVIFTSVGTSLPELITVITSIKKGSSNLGIGNIIGANILNIVQVIGVSAIILPLPLSEDKSILSFQVPFLLLMILSVISFGLYHKERFSKWNGIWLFVLYLIFLSVNLFRDATPFLGPLLF